MWLATATVLASAFAPIARTQASGDSEGTTTYKAGLVTVCSTDTFVRVAGVNDSPLAVTITSTEKSSDGSSGRTCSTATSATSCAPSTRSRFRRTRRTQ